MSLGGTLDFQGQSAQSLRFLESVAINAAFTQTFNVDSLLAPMDQGLVFFWVATGGYLGNPCTVFVNGSAAGALFSNESRIQSGKSITVPLLGQVAVSALVTPITVNVNKPSDTIGPMIGTLLVFAQTAPVQIAAVRRYDTEGVGWTSTSVNVAAGTTATVLAAPVQGYTFRLKCLSWWTIVAPAANQRVTWLDGGAGFLCGTMAGPAQPLQSQVPIDMENDTGVTFTNNTSVTLSTVVAAELWPRN